MFKRLAFPLYRRFWKLYLSIFFIGVLSCVLMVGLSTAAKTFTATMDEFCSTYGKADVTITTALSEGTRALSRIRNVEGVEEFQSRLTFDAVAQDDNGRYLSVRVFTYSSTGVLSYDVVEGRPIALRPMVMLNYEFAEANNIHVGDTFHLFLEGEKVDVRLNSIVTSSETISVQFFDTLYTRNNDFGYAYINKAYLQDTAYASSFNQVLLSFQEGASWDETLETVLGILEEEGIAVSKVVAFEDSGSMVRIHQNTLEIQKMGFWFPLIYFFIAMLVIYLFVTLLFHQYRMELGILLSNGVEPRTIRRIFLFMMALVALAAFFVGTAIGVRLGVFMSRRYIFFIPNQEPVLALDIPRALFSFISLLLALELPTLAALSRLDRIHPSEIFHRRVSSAELPHYWKRVRVSPLLKCNLFSLVRARERFLFTILCFSGTVLIIYSCLGFHRGIEVLLEKTFHERMTHNMELVYQAQPEEEFLTSLIEDGLASNLVVVPYCSATLEWKGKTVSSAVYALPKGEIAQELILDRKGKELRMEDGLILNSKDAMQLGIKVGDEVSLDGVVLRVDAISDLSTNFVQYLPLDKAQELGEPDAYLVFLDTADENLLLSSVLHSSGYLFALSRDVLFKSNQKSLDSIRILIWFLLGIALLLGLLFNTNILQCILLERKKEFGVLLSMGIPYSAILRNLLGVLLFQFALSLVLGIPAGRFVVSFIARMLSSEYFLYKGVWGIREYLLTVFISFAYILLGLCIAMWDMKKWQLSEIIKDKE